MLANLIVAVVVLAFAALGWYVLQHLDSAMFPDEGSPHGGYPSTSPDVAAATTADRPVDRKDGGRSDAKAEQERTPRRARTLWRRNHSRRCSSPHDPNHGGGGARRLPRGAQGRLCAQCRQPTVQTGRDRSVPADRGQDAEAEARPAPPV